MEDSFTLISNGPKHQILVKNSSFTEQSKEFEPIFSMLWRKSEEIQSHTTEN